MPYRDNQKLRSLHFAMKKRCSNPKDIQYPRYGGRGITVCERWLISFENFIEDMGERPTERHSIERIDNDGNYDPLNCRWATMREQQNNKYNTIKVTIGSETKALSYWADDYDISYNTIKARIRLGWPLNKELFSQPSFVSYNRTKKSKYIYGLLKKDIDYCEKKIERYNKEIKFLENRMHESNIKLKEYIINDC